MSILEFFGQMQIDNVLWVWDYATNKSRIKSKITKEEIAASERAKYKYLKTKQ